MKSFFRSFGLNAIRVLGFGQYMRFLLALLVSLPRVVRAGNLHTVDLRMSRRVRVKVFGRHFIIDCRHVDDSVNEPGGATFVYVREIYIWNCYLRHHAVDPSTLKNVIDLGGNRGLFTLLAANFDGQVVYVECNPKFIPPLQHNLKLNGFRNVAIENVFVGDGGLNVGMRVHTKSLSDILRDHAMERVDFLKVDIEGSEFALFKEAHILDRVQRLTMEVHQEYGDVNELIKTLTESGFRVISCNGTCEVTADITKVCYLYASR